MRLIRISSVRKHSSARGLKNQADGRKPPVAFRTEGARAAKRVASALAEPLARGLPPNGIGFHVFCVLWMTLSPLKRLHPIMRGERSMSIGR
jgi:hypothetical protein